MTTFFANLQSKQKLLTIEIQRQVDHLWRKLSGLPFMRNSMITSHLFLGGQYGSQGLLRLQHLGIRAVVNMRLTSLPKYQRDWLEYLHLPTPDHHAPTMAQLMNGVAFITKNIAEGKKVYIHCRHGEGRGPTMAIAYLISAGLTVEDALYEVQRVRSFARPTPAQMNRLSAYAERLKQVAEDEKKALSSGEVGPGFRINDDLVTSLDE